MVLDGRAAHLLKYVQIPTTTSQHMKCKACHIRQLSPAQRQFITRQQWAAHEATNTVSSVPAINILLSLSTIGAPYVSKNFAGSRRSKCKKRVMPVTLGVRLFSSPTADFSFVFVCLYVCAYICQCGGTCKNYNLTEGNTLFHPRLVLRTQKYHFHTPPPALSPII